MSLALSCRASNEATVATAVRDAISCVGEQGGFEERRALSDSAGAVMLEEDSARGGNVISIVSTTITTYGAGGPWCGNSARRSRRVGYSMISSIITNPIFLELASSVPDRLPLAIWAAECDGIGARSRRSGMWHVYVDRVENNEVVASCDACVKAEEVMVSAGHFCGSCLFLVFDSRLHMYVFALLSSQCS